MRKDYRYPKIIRVCQMLTLEYVLSVMKETNYRKAHALGVCPIDDKGLMATERLTRLVGSI